ncbi:MAG: hypothetical protein K0R15_2411 [Clostridiales bacterium]|jgi:hypothetical protein|nr:hypothetical protein [Clostridiales bacterium]
MKECNKLDERHILVREDIYKHMVFVIGILLLLDFYLKELGVVWDSGKYSSIIILYISFTFGWIEMICRGVYLIAEKQHKSIVYIMGLIAVVFISKILKNVILDGDFIFVQGQLTKTGILLVRYLCMLLIPIILLIKTKYILLLQKRS